MRSILEIVAVLLLGGLTGFGELIGRYRDEPIRAASRVAGWAYIAINAVAAGVALFVIRAFDWRFGLGSETPPTAVSVVQVLVAGLAAAALFRTSLFTVRMGSSDVGIGPSALLDVLLRSVDRSVDRARAVDRLRLVADLPPTLSFERDAIALAGYAAGSLQNVSAEEAEWLGNRGNTLRLDSALTDDVKIRLFAMDLMILVGEGGLHAAIQQFKESRAGSASSADSVPETATSTAPELPMWTLDAGPDEDADVAPAVGEDDGGEADSLPVYASPPVTPAEEARLDELVEGARRAVELTPQFAEAHLQLGGALAARVVLERSKPDPSFSLRSIDQRSFFDATSSIQKALALQPTYVDAYLELGRVSTLNFLASPSITTYGAEAESALRMALQLSDSPEMEAAVTFQLAVLGRALGWGHPECLRWLDRSVATGAASDDGRLASAASARARRTSGALIVMKSGVAASPGYAPFWILLGLLHHQASDDVSAAAALVSATDVVDSSTLDWETYARRDLYLRRVGEGIAYQRRGDSAEAVAVLGPALIGFVPGCDFPEPVADAQEPPEWVSAWSDLGEVAARILGAVLRTHIGEPVVRAVPQPVADTPAPAPA